MSSSTTSECNFSSLFDYGSLKKLWHVMWGLATNKYLPKYHNFFTLTSIEYYYMFKQGGMKWLLGSKHVLSYLLYSYNVDSDIQGGYSINSVSIIHFIYNASYILLQKNVILYLIYHAMGKAFLSLGLVI